MNAEKPIAFNEPFTYTEKDVRTGLSRTRKTYKTYSKQLGKSEFDQEYAQRVVKRYEIAITMAKQFGTDGILDLLRQLHQQVSTLEQQGVDRVTIARKIEQERPHTITSLRDIMHKGWIERLFQSNFAASI